MFFNIFYSSKSFCMYCTFHGRCAVIHKRRIPFTIYSHLIYLQLHHNICLINAIYTCNDNTCCVSSLIALNPCCVYRNLFYSIWLVFFSVRLQPDYDDIEEEENRLTGTMKQFTSSRGKDKVKDNNNKKYGKYFILLPLARSFERSSNPAREP